MGKFSEFVGFQLLRFCLRENERSRGQGGVNM
jgi:hypothetical protein